MDFMKSRTKEKRCGLIDAFNSNSRYLDDLLNIDNTHFEHMVNRINPAELQLNKPNASDTEAAVLDLNLSIHNDRVSTKISYMINGVILILILLIFRSLMAISLDVPLMVYIYLNLFVFSVTDFNNRNEFLTAERLMQGYQYHKLRKTFSKLYRRHFELIEKYHVSLKKNLCNNVFVIQNAMEIWYIFKKIIGNQNFSGLFKRIVNRFKRAGYTLDIMR